MDNSLLKRLLIIVIISIIIITTALLIIIKVFFNTQEEYQKVFVEGDAGEEVNLDRHEVEEQEQYYAIRDYINNYLSFDNNGNKEVSHKEYIYSLLSKEYILDNEITIDNVLSKVDVFSKKVEFIPLEMKQEVGDVTNTFYTHGLIVDEENNLEKETYFIVILDGNNKTYAIYPLDYKYKDLDEIKYNNKNNEIEVNDYNKYESFPYVNFEYLAIEYFDWYKRLSILSTERVYNSLLDEYKELRFPKLSDFESYVEKNKEQIKTAEIVTCTSNFYGDYTEHKIKDKNDNIYIFRDYGKGNIKIQLDDYTIENEISKTEYEELSEKDKGILNINKFFEMLRFKDYESAYNVLDEEFRTSKFGSKQEFQNYIENNIDADRKIMVLSYQEHIKHTYFYKLMYKDSENNKTFINAIVKLNNDNTFTMSFEKQ